MSIDPAQPIPVYFQLKTLLLQEILGGRYGPGDRFPTEHELCHLYGISRTPVTRALSELADEGVILRQRRHGTFVNPHWLTRRPGEAELRVVVPDTGPWGQMVRAAAPDGVAVNVVAVPRPALHQTLTHAVAEGRAPDLALLDSVWAPEFAAAGFLQPLESLDAEWVAREHQRDFLTALVNASRHDGGTFAVSAFADVAGLWYRREPVESLGLAPPETWAELRLVGRALARSGAAHPIVMPGGSSAGETTAYCLVAFLASNGARVLGPAGVMLGARAAQALRFLRKLVDDGLMPAEVVAYEWTRPVQLLAANDAAISFGGSYEATTLAEALGVPVTELWDHVGFVPVPAGPKGPRSSVTGTMVFGIFRQAAEPKLAMRLLERIVAPEAVAEVARTTGRIPSRRSAIALAAPHLPFLSETVDMLEHAITRPATPLYPHVSVQLQAMLEAVLTGRLGAAAAVQRAAEMISVLTGMPIVGEDVAPTAVAAR
jgi:ABC-type glycerol-3-phosphate transport system substrate-binding protein